MSLIGGILAARHHVFSWFGGLALTAKAGIATAFFVTMSAGVVIGAPYTPTSAPWLTPTVASYETLQTPSALQPSVVEAATPLLTAGGSGTSKNARPTGTSTAATKQPTSEATATSTGAVATTTKLATTMAPATSATTTSKTATALPTSASVYYKNCAEASKSGAAPITSGQPGYRTGLDLNRNGIACEPK